VKSRMWLIYAIVTVSFWGIWGALIEVPEKAGFPATLGYTVWAFTMIPPGLVALYIIKWKLEHDWKSIFFGSMAGLLGCGGQLILFQVLTIGPAYLVFPIIALSPIVTVLLSVVLLKERTTKLGWIGVIMAIIAIPLLSYQPAEGGAVVGYLWLAMAIMVCLAWGIQAYVIKLGNRTMKAESIFVYMMLVALLLIPVAIMMTDFSQEINWGFKGPYLAAMIMILNSIGALCLVYALRYGKAIIVSPMINALAPVLTVVLSLIIYAVIPHPVIATGMILAPLAAFVMAREEAVVEAEAETEQNNKTVEFVK
jgi:drug/metabolite transporter (DMT)-like permease